MRRVVRIPWAFGKAQLARDVDDELAFHLEMRTQRLVAAGLTPDAARQEALRQFGNVDTIREDCVIMDEQRERTTKRANLIGELHQDVMYALRTLRRNAGFTAIIVGALALGIGANTAIFTLIDAVVVRTLPVHDADQLVAIGDPTRIGSLSQGSPRTDLISYPLYRDIRDNAHSLSGVLASGRPGRLDVQLGSANDAPEHPRARYISANYFTVLGLKPAAGRLFDGTEDRAAGGAPVTTISYGYWTRRFHNDRSVIGRSVLINDTRVTIIGVAPPEFSGEIVGANPDLWLPVSMHDVLHPTLRLLNDRGASWLLLLGRLAPGTTLAQARQELKPLIERTIAKNLPGAASKAFLDDPPKSDIGSGARGFSRVRGTFAAPLFTLMIGVVLLLCIICANVATLLLARAVARGREMAVRLALGAERARLVRQLLTESIVLALFGAGAGLLVSWWGSHALLTLASGSSTIPLALGIDVRILAFTLAMSFFAVLLFGLAPALRASRVELATTMRGASQAVTGSALGRRGQRAPLGTLLIIGQVALSVVLLVGAGLLVRSLGSVQSVDVGMDRDHLVIADLDVNARGYTGARLVALAHTLRDRVAVIPGVAAVTFSENGVFSGTESGTTLEVPGFVAHTSADTNAAYDLVGPGYVAAIGAHLVAGRDLTTADENVPVRTALVNQSLASFYFPNENAIGKYLHFDDSVSVQIVGVVRDVRDHSLDGAVNRRIYFPFAHSDTAIGVPGSLRLELRTAGNPSSVVQAVREAITAVDPRLPIDGVDPLPTLLAQSIQSERLVARLATAFGVLALLLAGIGLYGVMTYAITRRTGEIGLRVALGAQRHDVVTMVLGDALGVVAVGMVIGLPLALASTRLLRAQLHGVGVVDPISIIAALVVLSMSAVLAVLVPALRASRVSPIVALRAE